APAPSPVGGRRGSAPPAWPAASWRAITNARSPLSHPSKKPSNGIGDGSTLVTGPAVVGRAVTCRAASCRLIVVRPSCPHPSADLIAPGVLHDRSLAARPTLHSRRCAATS